VEREYCIRVNPDGSSQVIDWEPGRKLRTAEARRILATICHRCRKPIGREPYHMVKDEYYHSPACVVI